MLFSQPSGRILICQPYGRLPSLRLCQYRLAEGALEYVNGPKLRHQTRCVGVAAPSPHDEYPGFPNVIFRYHDDSPRLGFPREHVRSIIAQIVPSSCNKYSVKFRDAEPVVWDSAWGLYDELRAHEKRTGEGVIAHPRVDGVEVVGISRGCSRFVVGAGISLYVKQVIGAVPDGVYFGEVVTQGMVAVRACRVPGIGGASLTYHVLPAEYVSDSPLPEFLRNLSPMDLKLYLPPPPVFSQGGPLEEDVAYSYARVRADISFRERLDGGRIVPNGMGLFFENIAQRGVPYLRYRGFVEGD